MLVDHYEAIAAALRGEGWWCADGALAGAEVATLRADLQAHRDRLGEAAVGRSGERQLDPGIRADLTCWLDGGTPAQRRFLGALEQLRLVLNQRLFLGLFDYEAHYACYPQGAGYLRHVDAFRGATCRLLSTVFYLNDGWREGDGGELRLWDEAGGEVATLTPLAGRAVIFLSEEFPHEVMPACRERLSIAGWFRVRELPWRG